MKKSIKRECFCALCRSPRKLRYHRRLQGHHYFQILVLTIGVTAAFYPWLEWRGAASLPIIMAVFDYTYKSLYRKDLQCPFCGFDPTWYKKDIKIARKQVEQFLKQNPDSPVLKKVQAQQEFFQSVRQ